MKKYIKSNVYEPENLVIFKRLWGYCVTPESNYYSRISDDSKIVDCRDFDSPQQIIDYYVKYCNASPSDFIIIDD